MAIKIISLFKERDSPHSATEREYLDRMRRSLPIELMSPGKFTDKDPKARQKQEQAYVTELNQKQSVVLLGERGKEMQSTEFAKWLEKRLVQGKLNFVIAGPQGWQPEFFDATEHTLSLSKFTMPSSLARLVLIEQLYRADTILRGVGYHK